MENRKTYLRTGFMFFFLFLLLLWFMISLYDLQIVHGAEALARSSKKITSRETVEAARGEITDRNGMLLVSNCLQYDVQLDPSIMGNTQAKNEQILSLVNLCLSLGISYEDSLPLSQSAPFSDISNELTEGQQVRFASYLKAKHLEETPNGSELLQALREEYKIDESYSQEDARKIAGIRYELDLRDEKVTYLEYIFAKDVDIEFITTIKETGLSGVKIKNTTVRNYHTKYAAHILGRVGQMNKTEWPKYQTLGYPMNAFIGKDGVEAAFESYLHGIRGTRIQDLNASGKVVDETYSITPQPGQNVMLTLDLQVQEAAENALAEFISSKKTAKGGAAVVIDVNDGGILAMASYPTYDLSEYNSKYTELFQDPLSPLYNRATLGTYPPGSTFKMVTAVGGLEEGIITPTDKILDTGRYTFYRVYQPMCWIYRQHRKTHGRVNVTEALEVSCNIFFYDVGRRLTIQTLDEYASKFGLGKPTGIELEENTGILAGPESSEKRGTSWEGGSVLAAAIGQSDNSFTPLQLCNYIATLVNGGTHYSAHLLKSVKSYNYSNTTYEYEPNIIDTIDISSSTLNAVKAGMLAVTQRGTAAKYFSNLNVTAGAKTGSAQVGAQSESNAVFVCFAPYENPEIAVAIVVEKGGAGYELAAVAREILESYFQTDAYPQNKTGEQTLVP